MKYLRKYESHADIASLCRKFGIRKYTINTDESIDVYGTVDICNKILGKLPLKFNKIRESFICISDSLTTLEYSPKYVGQQFICRGNKLTTLKGAPLSVGGNFSCIDNNIDTFEGLDFIHVGNFYCVGNPIWYVWGLFRDHTKFEFFNDCDIIRENRVIILDRLNFFPRLYRK